jgi:hypothetical protein
MATYQQIFLDTAFGNFEDLMTRVTLSSVMGDYLNMVNNDKPSGVNPNENYARELLQLFSIGLWELKPDGTRSWMPTGSRFPRTTRHGRRLRARVHRMDRIRAVRRHARTHNPKNFLGDMVARRVQPRHRRQELLERRHRAGEPGHGRDLANAMRNVFCIRTSGRSSVAADPEARHRRSVAAVRRARRRACSTTTARACAAT